MEQAEIEHLATLARIAVTPEEAKKLAHDITGVLSYVRQIEEITGTGPLIKEVGSLHTVMREDENPHEAGLYTEDLLARAPKRYGAYVEVQKIIDQKK